jgi:hypothetical protein
MEPRRNNQQLVAKRDPPESSVSRASNTHLLMRRWRDCIGGITLGDGRHERWVLEATQVSPRSQRCSVLDALQKPVLDGNLE